MPFELIKEAKFPSLFHENLYTSFWVELAVVRFIIDFYYDEDNGSVSNPNTYFTEEPIWKLINSMRKLEKDKKAKNISLFIWTPRYKNRGHKYSIDEVIKIKKGKDEVGQDAWIYYVKNKKNPYLDSLIADKIEEIKNIKTVWEKSKIRR